MDTTRTKVALHVSLVDVALLARVQRPVVSMWRARSTDTDAPFPDPVAVEREQERFDLDQVVDWIELTGRGNNPHARDDAAAFASLAGQSPEGDAILFHGLTALLCLKTITGVGLTGRGAADVLDLADEADPDDEFIYADTEALGDRLEAVSHYADLLASAAFNPVEAFERLMRQRFRLHVAGHTSVAVSRPARDLVAFLAAALAAEAGLDAPLYVDPTTGGSDLLVALADQFEEGRVVTALTPRHAGSAARLARRRLRVHGIPRDDLAVDPDGSFAVTGPAVVLAQYPSPGMPAMTDEQILMAIDNILLQMDDDQRAVVIAPASALTEPLTSQATDDIRTGMLRTDRVRAIVRLPRGLVTAKPQQRLALWTLGPALPDVDIADRWTMVCDLAGAQLDSATTDQLVTDVVAAMGSRATVWAHAFRFASRVLTRTLLTSSDGLTATAPPVHHHSARDGADVAVRVEEVRESLMTPPAAENGLGFTAQPRTAPARRIPTETLGQAIASSRIRLISGNRLDGADLSVRDGVPVIGPDEVTGSLPVGHRTIDKLTFSTSYPAGRYTEPGDVVFCTAPRPAAIVDAAGTSVVAFPARVLRTGRDAPNGYVPEVLAMDVNAAGHSTNAWRTWVVRRAPVDQIVSLSSALTEIEHHRAAARSRLAQLDRLAALLADGVTQQVLELRDSDSPAKGS